MSREIKFRAWDGTRNNWLHDTDHAFSILGEATLFGTVLQRSDDTFISLSECNKVIFEQFTGLLDKNGKEIYEGDILDFCYETYPDDTKSPYSVIFNNGSFCRKWKNWPDDLPPTIINKNILLILRDTIIGNIHENPDLLNNESEKS